MLAWVARAVALLSVAALLVGCPAVYPEVATRMRRAQAGQELDPPPPEELRWIRFSSARVPEKTRDGRSWGRAAGSMPDPYAKLIVNGKELLRTPAQSDTLTPTWPSAPRGNFRIGPDDTLRVELWDANAMTDLPVGVRDVGRPTQEHRAQGVIRVELEGGGGVDLAFEPAHAMFGLGLWFELRTDSAYITRTLEGSPAARAGLLPGDQVLRIGGREVSTMSADEIRSAFNSVPSAGIALALVHADGTNLSVTLREGPIYPTFEQVGALD